MKKIFLVLFCNLIFGNLILYFHEIFGRQQSNGDANLWMSFSFASVLVLLLALQLLQRSQSGLKVLLLSVVVSLLIPTLGFFGAMGFSMASLLIGASYVFYGFPILVLPMVILNFFLFRWSQR